MTLLDLLVALAVVIASLTALGIAAAGPRSRDGQPLPYQPPTPA